jgi:hypothetical protein
MKNVSRAVITLSFAVALPALAQRREEGTQAHWRKGPPQGPPAARAERAPPPAPPPRREKREEPPHVDRKARWVGHETGPQDSRYRLERPWANGRFAGPVGRGHVYRLRGWEAPRHRFWFGNSYFIVSPADYAYANHWSWRADQIVLYDDPDHQGWYLAYNTRLGTYLHVQYDGALP